MHNYGIITEMSKISTSDFQKGIFIEFKGEPHQITEFQFVNPGKGSAFVRTKLKSLNSGRVAEFTYKSGDTVDEVPIHVREMQYLYKTDNIFFLMDQTTYEQTTVSKDIIGDFHKFMKEGEIYQILIHENQAVGMRYPKKIRMKVISADDGAKGNTVSGAKKLITIETGVEIAVPIFIKEGDIISIDPLTGEYLERNSQK